MPGRFDLGTDRSRITVDGRPRDVAGFIATAADLTPPFPVLITPSLAPNLTRPARFAAASAFSPRVTAPFWLRRDSMPFML